MKYIIVILQSMFISTLLSTMWIVKQDGTGDFTSIQSGINAAVPGDTVLVYPGIYYERINYHGKSITVTGLYDGDLYDVSYIANTVIDGNHEGTVVLFVNGETRNAVLNGFTIRNGRGEAHGSGPSLIGGGLCIRFASPVISNCIIEHNYAQQGGGLYLWQGNPLLKGNTIRYNHASFIGGITALGIDTNLEFCNQSLNNVYLNYSGRACELRFGGINQSSVVIDTFTVLNPDGFFISYIENNMPDFELTINHGKIEPVAADLYVAPHGCDSNSGLTPAEPLQTIAMATIMIAPDSLVQRSIHVAEGIYSRSLNNQLFPVSLRGHIAIIGAGKEKTILDGENEYSLLSAVSNETDFAGPIRNFAAKNMSLINGSSLIRSIENRTVYFGYSSNYLLENINVTNCHTTGEYIIFSGVYDGEYEIKNLSVQENSGSIALFVWHGYNDYDFRAENIRVRNHNPGPPCPDYMGGSGIGMVVSSYTSSNISDESKVDIVNLEVTDNHISNVPAPWVGLPRGNMEIKGPGTIRIINATIGNNSSTNLTGGGLTFGEYITHLELINSIVYGNTPHNIAVQHPWSNQGHIYISHSLIQGGEADILYFQNPNTIVHWGEGNITGSQLCNPLWLGEVYPDYDGEYPYMLHRNSPARNAGTLDIPGFEFPEFDLAGNPRISGSSIDMGAYEYQGISTGTEDCEDLLTDLSVHDYRLYNYPNPVVGMQGMGAGRGVGTTISFIMPQEGEAVIDIYNLKGQFVKRVFNAKAPAGEYEVLWNGTDEQGRIVATGFYMYRLMINGKQVAAGRCTFVR